MFKSKETIEQNRAVQLPLCLNLIRSDFCLIKIDQTKKQMSENGNKHLKMLKL